jgi:hypothetical protein
MRMHRRTRGTWVVAAVACGLGVVVMTAVAWSKNSGPPTDRENIQARQDIKSLPKALKERLVALARRPHTYAPMRAFAEADAPSQLFEYYLLDTTAVAPNVFTAIVPGVSLRRRPHEPA